MILVDLPWLPLPDALSRLLARCGIVLRQQAARLHDIDPAADSIHQLIDGNWEWKAILDGQEADLHTRLPASDFLGLSRAVVLRALLRQINGRLFVSYRFFRLMSRLRPRQHHLVLAAPKAVRDSFVAHGLPLNQPLSSALWGISRCGLLAHALWTVVRNAVRSLLDGARQSGRPDASPILWLGLAASELNAAPGELNALDFVRGRRLPLFREGLPIYVSTPWRKQVEHVPDVDAFLCPDPIRALFAKAGMRGDRWQVIKDSFIAAARIARDGLRRDGRFVLLARDYAALPYMRRWFTKVRPRAVLMTNSMYASHPLWVAYGPASQSDVVMLFYATNVLPMYFRGGRDCVRGDPAYRLLECTRFEVWTESQKQWLVSLGIAEGRVNVAGVIVWGRDDALANRRNGSARPADRPLRIGLFDVIPPNPTYFLQFGLGDNYYTFERMAQLLTDVVEVAESLPGATFEVVVKAKRARVAIHDGRYFDLQEQLVRAGRIKVGLLPMNPIDAVAACDLVVSAPFSSPSVIAVQMEIPGCFYDPVGLLLAHPGLAPEAPLVHGRDELRQWMLEHRFTPG